MEILGWLMIIAVFASVFFLIAREEGWAAALYVYGGTLLLGVWVAVAIYFIGGNG